MRALALIILSAFSASIYSCQTVYTENRDPEELKMNEDVRYLEARTINDSTINLTDYNVTYYENYKDFSNKLLLEKTDTVVIKDKNRSVYKFKKSLTELNLKEIKKLKVEITKFNWGKTVLICTGVIFLAFITLVIISTGLSSVSTGSFNFK